MAGEGLNVADGTADRRDFPCSVGDKGTASTVARAALEAEQVVPARDMASPYRFPKRDRTIASSQSHWRETPTKPTRQL